MISEKIRQNTWIAQMYVGYSLPLRDWSKEVNLAFFDMYITHTSTGSGSKPGSCITFIAKIEKTEADLEAWVLTQAQKIMEWIDLDSVHNRVNTCCVVCPEHVFRLGVEDCKDVSGTDNA